MSAMELNGTVVLRESHGRRVLLICTNVGSIFEDPDVMLRTWVDEITSTIFAHDADFVALHMQEVGGKSFKTGMAMVDSVIQTLRDEPTLNDYDRARFHCYQDFNVLERFTALGALFLVRNSIPEHEIQQWNFAKGEYESMASLVASASTPIPTHSASDYVVEEKFDFNLFPTALKSRKGFQWSRWRIANQQFDVINLHLFHDESNLVSWQKHHGDSGSQYAQSRRLALETMLARCSIGDDEAAFLLGDFNFRLHLYDAVRFLVSDVGADLARRGSFDDPSEATRIVATARDSLPTCEPQHVRDTNSKLTKLVFRGRGGTSTLPAPFETKMSSSSMSIYMGDRSDMANSQGDLSGSAENATPEIVTTDATHTAPVSTTATATVVGVATEKSLKHDVKRGRLDTEDAEVACAADNAARSDLTIPQVDVRAATPHEGSNGTTAEATPVATVVIGEASSDAVYEPGPTRDLSALSVPPKWSRTSSMMSHASETSEVSDCDGASGSLSLSSVIPTDDGGQSTVVVTPPTATSQAASGSETPTNDDDDGPVLLEIEKKKFRLAVERWKLFSQNNGAALLPFDEEPALFTSPRMYEQPRIFAPTYPFEEDNSKGAMYMPTRCPAWCDRILMTAAGQSMVTRAQAPPIYDSFSKSICVGDHKPVLLAFSLPPMVFYESSV